MAARSKTAANDHTSTVHHQRPKKVWFVRERDKSSDGIAMKFLQNPLTKGVPSFFKISKLIKTGAGRGEQHDGRGFLFRKRPLGGVFKGLGKSVTLGGWDVKKGTKEGKLLGGFSNEKSVCDSGEDGLESAKTVSLGASAKDTIEAFFPVGLKGFQSGFSVGSFAVIDIGHSLKGADPFLAVGKALETGEPLKHPRRGEAQKSKRGVAGCSVLVVVQPLECFAIF